MGALFGNDALWVTLPPDGTVSVGAPWKFPWVRLLAGDLSIGVKQVDSAAPLATTHIPTGYGASGFQSSLVTFPTRGCWEVTGTVANRSLRFTVAAE